MSCQVDTCMCIQVLTMCGDLTICIGCKHPVSVHQQRPYDNDITIIGSLHLGILLGISKIVLTKFFYIASQTSTRSMTRILPTTHHQPVRSSTISAEVNYQRNLTNRSQPQSRPNVFAALGSQPAKPVTRSLALWFFPKGNARGSFHGVPTVLHFTRSKPVPDWQHYLTN